MKTIGRIHTFFWMTLLVMGLSGCALAIGAAAGGTAVYVMKDKGYKVQAPVTKDK